MIDVAVPAVGDEAPDFSLRAHSGEQVTLSDYRGSKNVLLIFYPMDFSSVCNMQLPEFSARRDDFADLDAVVFGVNRDSVYTHRAWAAEYGIDVPLLSDMTFSVARQYGVHLEHKGHSRRATFLIDKAGRVRVAHVEDDTDDFTMSADEVLEQLRAVDAEG